MWLRRLRPLELPSVRGDHVIGLSIESRTGKAWANAMKRATAFMVDKVGPKGAFVWSYLPDLSRRWGEMEARETTIWLQPPGTPTMGHLFLDAYHATGDEAYYRAAELVANTVANFSFRMLTEARRMISVTSVVRNGRALR